MSITCDSYEDFKKGKCASCNRDGNFCVRFGFHSHLSYKSIFEKGYFNSSPIATYLMTGEKDPFCTSHYRVTVKISGSEESRLHGGEIGILFLKLRSEGAETRKIQLNQLSVYFSPGSNHTFMTTGDDIEDIETVMVEYDYKQTMNPLTWRLKTPRIYVEFITVESMEHNTFIKVCPHHQLPVAEVQGVLFKEDSCHYKKKNSF